MGARTIVGGSETLMDTVTYGPQSQIDSDGQVKYKSDWASLGKLGRNTSYKDPSSFGASSEKTFQDDY
jgi:hypothetical protein